MILIGQYDSPFVRRVAVALQLYRFPYEHRPWSTFGDGEKLAAFNPLRRVPTLVLDDGEVLIESAAILDYLDEQAGPERRLIPAAGPERRAALRICALATGLCDKMVALIYERALHEATSAAWIARCETQIAAVLDVLEGAPPTPGHAEIAIACAMRFLGEAHPAIAPRWPRLAALAAACEARPAFAAVTQRFVPPQ